MFLSARRIVIFLVFSFILVVAFSCGCGGISVDSSVQAVDCVAVAEVAVSSAFKAVCAAEAAGADVTRLVVELNDAVRFLVEARVLLADGLVDEAVEAAGLAVEVAGEVRDKAGVLRDAALAQREILFKASVLGGIVGVPVFLAFMWLVWQRFRSYYARRVLGLRPEVPSDAEA